MNTGITEDGFLQLIQQNKGIIQKVCGLYGRSLQDRQDLYQEIVIQLWKSFPRYRGEAKISTWMYRVALNTAISDFRKQKRSIVSVSLHKTPVRDHVEETDPAVEQWQTLRQAIDGLSEIEKAVVMLYLEDRSYEEMEDVLGVSQATLRVKMNRIKEKLKKKVTLMDNP